MQKNITNHPRNLVLNDLINQIRIAAGRKITHQEIADAIGYKRASLSKAISWEAKGTAPAPRSLVNMIRGFYKVELTGGVQVDIKEKEFYRLVLVRLNRLESFNEVLLEKVCEQQAEIDQLNGKEPKNVSVYRKKLEQEQSKDVSSRLRRETQ